MQIRFFSKGGKRSVCKGREKEYTICGTDY